MTSSAVLNTLVNISNIYLLCTEHNLEEHVIDINCDLSQRDIFVFICCNRYLKYLSK